MQDAGWLQRYTELGRDDAAGVPARGGIRGAALPASLLREADLRDASCTAASVSWDALPDLYVEHAHGGDDASGTTRADAFVDVDPRFYAARYLRAWQLQALLTETLVERYDADWWRNPRAGPWIVRGAVRRRRSASWRRSWRSAWRGRRCRFAPLIRSVERMLA